MNIRTLLLTATALAPWGGTALADDSDLARCAKIASPLDRLECYDALAQKALAVLPAEAVQSTPGAPAVAAVPVAAPAAPSPAAEPVADDFGFEGNRINETPDEVTARYEGDFTGWSGQTLFKLDNGQVWKQTQNGRVSHRRSNPEITIRKGAFGSFRLSVEGLNKTIRVKRIK